MQSPDFRALSPDSEPKPKNDSQRIEPIRMCRSRTRRARHQSEPDVVPQWSTPRTAAGVLSRRHQLVVVQ